MAAVGNSTCARFDNVVRTGGHHQHDVPVLYVKGTWFPSEFTLSICDGVGAWTGRATKDLVVNSASHLALTESEYVDSVQFYFSKQQPNARYELKFGSNSFGPELLCSKILPHELILRLDTIVDSGPGVAVDMVQFLLDAYHRLDEELAKKTRAYDRDLAAKDLALTSLQTQSLVDQEPATNGLAVPGVGTSRGKRKAGVATVSRKRVSKPSEKAALALLYQSSLVPPVAARPPPLSELGYSQPKAREEPQSSKEPSWLDKVQAKDNGLSDDSLNSDEQPKMAFLERLSEAAEEAAAGGKKSGGKKQAKKKSAKRKPSLEVSLDIQAEDVVDKSSKTVRAIIQELKSPSTTPVKPHRKTPPSAKRVSPAMAKRSSPATAKKPSPATLKKPSKSASAKPKKQPAPSSSSRSKKKVKVNAEVEPNEAPESEPPAPATEEDRAITVQSAEFHDFDASRSETSFEKEQFWALYDDQDGMPRFYGRVIGVQNEPFQVSVEWLEPYKPNLPATGLVSTARLSAACGDFTFGSNCVQDLPAFSHVIQVGVDTVQVGRDGKKASVVLWPEKEEIWALYKQWNEKMAKKEDGDDEYHYDYDLVKVQSKLSTDEGIAVVPLVKVPGFKSLFTVADEDQTYQILYKHVQAIFSHCIPKHAMLGSESPGVPIGAWELDPASTPSEYLGTVVQEGMS